MTKGRIQVVLNTPDAIADKIAYYYRILTALTGNAHVTNLNPTLDVFKAQLNAVETSNSQVKTHGAAQRNLDLRAAEITVELYRQAVENACNANPAQAEIIAQSAAMSIKQHRTAGHKDSVHIESGDHPGEIKVLIKAVKGKAGYRIRHSLDDEKTYVDDGVSMNTTFVIKGLPIGAKVYVQCAVITGQDQGPWSDAVSFIVH